MSKTRMNVPNGHDAERLVVSAGPLGVFTVIHCKQSQPLCLP
jgi:hypothetical protein